MHHLFHKHRSYPRPAPWCLRFRSAFSNGRVFFLSVRKSCSPLLLRYCTAVLKFLHSQIVQKSAKSELFGTFWFLKARPLAVTGACVSVTQKSGGFGSSFRLVSRVFVFCPIMPYYALLCPTPYCPFVSVLPAFCPVLLSPGPPPEGRVVAERVLPLQSIARGKTRARKRRSALSLACGAADCRCGKDNKQRRPKGGPHKTNPRIAGCETPQKRAIPYTRMQASARSQPPGLLKFSDSLPI